MTLSTDGTVWVQVGSEVSIAKYSNGGDYLYYAGGEQINPDIDIDSLISELQDIRRRYKTHYTSMTINERRNCSCYSSNCDCSPTYPVFGRRTANKTEIDFYASQQWKAKVDEEARDRAELERLQRKLGVDVLT